MIREPSNGPLLMVHVNKHSKVTITLSQITLGNVHKGCPIFLQFLEIPTYLPTYVLYTMYYPSMYYVRFSLTYLPTQK